MKVVPLALAAVIAIAVGLRWRRLGWEARGGGLMLVAGFAVYGSGVVHIPNIEHLVRSIGGALGPYTYVLVGVMAFLETGAGVGLIAPGETFILLGGVVAGQGRISVVLMAAIVWAAAVAGDLTSYALGRRLGREFIERHGPRMRITPERLRQVDGFFARHGGATILIGRFVGLVRAVAPFLAGASRMPLRRFVPFDVVGAGAWGISFVLLGYVFWQSFDRVVAFAKRGSFALASAIIVVVGAVAAYRFLRVSANRRRVRGWLETHSRRPALRLLRAHGRSPAALLGVLALIGAAVFAALAAVVGRGGPVGIDRAAFDAGADLRAPVALDVARALTELGIAPVVGALALVAVVVLARAGQGWAASALAAGTLLTFAGEHFAKLAAGRPRPPGGLVATMGTSYPSGHSAQATIYVGVAVALGAILRSRRLARRLVVAAVAVAVLVGLTRIYLRAHYLTDVLGGWGLGLALLALCGLGARAVPRFVQNMSRR